MCDPQAVQHHGVRQEMALCGNSCIVACNCTWVTEVYLHERAGPEQRSQAASMVAATCIGDEVKMLRAPGP